MRKRFALLAALALAPCLAGAVPYYQLDIAGGRYDAASETIVTSAERFTLYAYAAQAPTLVRLGAVGPSILSISITPPRGPAPTDFGGFLLNGQVVSAADMRFGVPPFELDGTALPDAGDLAAHEPTFFFETQFSFAPNHTTSRYDTAVDTGRGPRTGRGMLYSAFDVDTSGLAPGVELHFDLYSTHVKNGDVDIFRFAPFSHDAGTIAAQARPVPEPSAAALFVVGLLVSGFSPASAASGLLRRR